MPSRCRACRRPSRRSSVSTMSLPVVTTSNFAWSGSSPASETALARGAARPPSDESPARRKSNGAWHRRFAYLALSSRAAALLARAGAEAPDQGVGRRERHRRLIARFVQQQLPAIRPIDAMHHELIGGFGDAVELVGAGVPCLIHGCHDTVLEVDGNPHRSLDADNLGALFAVAVRRAGAHLLEVAMQCRDRRW